MKIYITGLPSGYEVEHLARLFYPMAPLTLTPPEPAEDCLWAEKTDTGLRVLVRQGEAADHLFNITSGSVRVYRLMPDGRRQITGFLFAGDFLGLTTGGTYDFSAEAIRRVTAAIGEHSGPMSYLLGEKYIAALERMGEKENAKLVVLPADLQEAVRGFFGRKA